MLVHGGAVDLCALRRCRGAVPSSVDQPEGRGVGARYLGMHGREKPPKARRCLGVRADSKPAAVLGRAVFGVRGSPPHCLCKHAQTREGPPLLRAEAMRRGRHAELGGAAQGAAQARGHADT